MVRRSEASVKTEGLVGLVHSYSELIVFTNTFFEEVCFPLVTDHFYPLIQIAAILVMSMTAKVE